MKGSWPKHCIGVAAAGSVLSCPCLHHGRAVECMHIGWGRVLAGVGMRCSCSDSGGGVAGQGACRCRASSLHVYICTGGIGCVCVCVVVGVGGRCGEKEDSAVACNFPF